jgi:hypothetical protein
MQLPGRKKDVLKFGDMQVYALHLNFGEKVVNNTDLRFATIHADGEWRNKRNLVSDNVYWS